jgi:hypothetical protein
VEHARLPHRCRNFNDIHKWPKEYAYLGAMGLHHREMNDPLNPEIWMDGFSGS